MTATVHHGDCLAFMRSLPDKSVDHVITDPPYEAEAHTLQRRVKRAGGVAVVEPLTFAPTTPYEREAWGAEMARVVRRWCLVFCQVEAAMLWRNALASLAYRRTMIWVKPDGQPQLSGDRPGMGYESIVTAHAVGASRWNAGGKCGVYRFSKAHSSDLDGKHPTIKPESLMSALIRDFTDPGETLLDPFCGSGTTLVAAEYLGRNSIGCEINEKWAELARKRVAAVREQRSLAL